MTEPEAHVSVIARIVVVAVVLGLTGCTTTTTTTGPDPPSTRATPTAPSAEGTEPGPASGQPPSADFGAFADEVAWDLLARSPQLSTDLGLDTLADAPADRLDDVSAAYRERTAAIAGDARARLDRFDPDDLSPDERITASVLRWYLDDLVAMAAFIDHEYALSYITGVHAEFPEFMADIQPVESRATAQAYVTRLEQADEQMRRVAERLDRSEAAGILPTETGIAIARWQIGRVLDAPGTHPLVADFAARLDAVDAIPDADADALVDAAEAAVREHVLPGYRDLLAAADEATVRRDDTPGVGALPGGPEYYAAALRHHLTIDLTPSEVHDLGLHHVDRLVGELDVALSDMGYDVDRLGFAGAVARAREDGGVFALGTESDRAALLDRTIDEIARLEAAVAPVFAAMPASPVRVQRPRPGREGGAGAYYRAPPVFGERPGIYYLSLGGPSLDVQTYMTTNAHEAVPGHHFQLSLQRRADDLPLLQRSVVFTGYAEGWGLYAERLAHEAGIYDDDPHGDVGRLHMELLRAARAVVDTGIHHLGWSHAEAVAYLTDLGFPRQQATSEVDRYVVWPGQAPAYLVGLLEILRHRDRTARALGDGFDLAAFHDEILRHGSVPLATLDAIVDRFIETSS